MTKSYKLIKEEFDYAMSNILNEEVAVDEATLENIQMYIQKSEAATKRKIRSVQKALAILNKADTRRDRDDVLKTTLKQAAMLFQDIGPSVQDSIPAQNWNSISTRTEKNPEISEQFKKLFPRFPARRQIGAGIVRRVFARARSVYGANIDYLLVPILPDAEVRIPDETPPRLIEGYIVLFRTYIRKLNQHLQGLNNFKSKLSGGESAAAEPQQQAEPQAAVEPVEEPQQQAKPAAKPAGGQSLADKLKGLEVR
tara:strand:- start:1845 stop:2606 length:762 start_codon:yes stop_codon:yes gene_type:complete